MVKITNISCDNSYICRNYVHASNELDVSNTFKFVKQNTYIYGSRTAALQKYCYKQSNKCNCIQSNTANITDWILLKVDALLTLKVIIYKSSGKRDIFMELNLGFELVLGLFWACFGLVLGLFRVCFELVGSAENCPT